MDTRNKELLIRILRDRDADLAERDDAAMDLGECDDEEVIATLVAVAADPAEDVMLHESCGESIGEILLRGAYPAAEILEKLTPVAKDEALGRIRADRGADWTP